MNTNNDVQPTSPKRLEGFVKFFKGYMSLSAIIAAALPIPVTSFELTPVLPEQKGVLSVYTPLFCFLILGFIFYSRHSLARLMFPELLDVSRAPHGKVARNIARALVKYLPLILIALSISFVFTYQNFWWNAGQNLLNCKDCFGITDAATLKTYLMLLYIGIFLTAEASFIVMAIKEYLQDLVGLTEMELIYGVRAVAASQSATEEIVE